MIAVKPAEPGIICRIFGCRERVLAGYLICLRCDWMSRFGRR